MRSMWNWTLVLREASRAGTDEILDGLHSRRKGIESRGGRGETTVANPRGDGELVGPGVRRALVSEEDAGGRSAGVVRAAFRNGRGELELLFSAGSAARPALVSNHAGRF